MMPASNSFLVSATNLSTNTSKILYSCRLVVAENQFYVYSFAEKTEIVQLEIMEQTGLVSNKYLDRFLVIEPLGNAKKGEFWRKFFEYFSNIYEDAIDKIRNMDNISNLYNIILEHKSLSFDSKILDFACGTGLSANVITDVKLIGTDISSNMMKLARQQGLDVIELSKLKKRYCCYDAIFASYVLHLWYDNEILSMLWKLLKRDAVFVANFHKGKGANEVVSFFLDMSASVKKINNASYERHGDYYVFTRR